MDKMRKYLIDSFDYSLMIKNNWNKFIESVNKEKFSVDSHLLNSKPTELKDKHIVVQLSTKKDLEIITDSLKNNECLQEVSKSLLGKSNIFKIYVNEASSSYVSKSLSKKNNNSFETPLALAIKKELGGKEIKSY